MKVNLCGKSTVTKNGKQYVIIYFTYESSKVEGLAAGSVAVSAAVAEKLLANEANIRRGWNNGTRREYLYLTKE